MALSFFSASAVSVSMDLSFSLIALSFSLMALSFFSASAVSVSMDLSFSSMALAFSSTSAVRVSMDLSFSSMALSFSLMALSFSADALSSPEIFSVAASSSPCSFSEAFLPVSTSPDSFSASAWDSRSWVLTVSMSSCALARSSWRAAEFSCSLVSWATVLASVSLLAFSLLLNSSMAAMAATSSTSSTICQILLLFMVRPPRSGGRRR